MNHAPPRSIVTVAENIARTSVAPHAGDVDLQGRFPHEAFAAIKAGRLMLREIADFLSISEDVARDLLRKNKIRGFKAGGQWRAMPQAITAYVIEQLSKG